MLDSMGDRRMKVSVTVDGRWRIAFEAEPRLCADVLRIMKSVGKPENAGNALIGAVIEVQARHPEMPVRAAREIMASVLAIEYGLGDYTLVVDHDPPRVEIFRAGMTTPCYACDDPRMFDPADVIARRHGSTA